MGTTGETEEPTTFNFIRDQAAEVDAFGSHSKVATAISEVILGSDAVKMIGILGPWGSGKSTVIKGIEKRLQAKSGGTDIELFTYDAWVHQSDPPRRSFLETLIKELIDRGKISDEKVWNDKLDQLNGRVDETDTTTVPTLTRAAGFLLFALYLVPIGLPLMGYATIKDAFGVHATWNAYFAFIAGLGMVLAPFMVAIVTWIAWRSTWNPFSAAFWKKKNWLTYKESEKDSSIFSLFTNKTIQRVRTRVTRNPEPTAIEFQKVFQDLLAEIALKSVRLIIVIDNLDRLHGDEAVLMWTTIRSFMLGVNQKANFESLPLTLLPIDEAAILEMYTGNPKAEHLAQSFIDKTFDLTFRVTPPVWTDWKKYLEERIAQTFLPAAPKSWSYQVGRILEMYQDAGSSPAPRTINAAVNSIGSLWLQRRGDGISFVSLAYYAVLGPKAVPSILTGQTSTTVDISADDPNWQRSVAALHYGVAPEMALQVLLEAPLKDAIVKHDTTVFLRLADVPGFGEILPEVVGNRGTPAVAGFVMDAADLLSKLDMDRGTYMLTAWRQIRKQFAICTNWENLSGHAGSSFAAMLKFSGPSGLQDYFDRFVRRLSEFPSHVISGEEASAIYVEMCVALMSAGSIAGLPTPTFQINGDASTFIRICVDARHQPQVLARLIAPIAAIEMQLDLVRTLEGDADPETFDDRFDAMLKYGLKVDWVALVDSARNAVEVRNGASNSFQMALSVFGRLASVNENARNTIQSLVQSGLIGQRITEMGNDSERAVAIAATLVFEFGPPFSISVNWEEIRKKYPSIGARFESFQTEFAIETSTEKLILATRQDREIAPLTRDILGERLEHGHFGNVSLALISADFDAFIDCLYEEDEEAGVLAVSRNSTFWSDVDAEGLTEAVRRTLGAILFSTKHSSPQDIRDRAYQALVKKLGRVKLSEWRDAVKNNLFQLNLALDLQTIKPHPLENDGNVLFNALAELTTDLATSQASPAIERWFLATGLLSTSARRTLYKKLRNQSANSLPETIVALVEAGGERYLKEAGFDENPDGSGIHILIPISDDMANIAVWQKNISIFGGWVARGSKETKSVILEKLRNLIPNASNEDKTILIHLIEAIDALAEDVVTSRTDEKGR